MHKLARKLLSIMTKFFKKIFKFILTKQIILAILLLTMKAGGKIAVYQHKR